MLERDRKQIDVISSEKCYEENNLAGDGDQLGCYFSQKDQEIPF